jgi:hypothetical protein
VFSVLSVPKCYKQEKLGAAESCWSVDKRWGSVVVTCCTEKLVAEAGAVPEPRGRRTSAVGILYQATADIDSSGLRIPIVPYSDLWSVVTSCVRVQ